MEQTFNPLPRLKDLQDIEVALAEERRAETEKREMHMQALGINAKAPRELSLSSLLRGAGAIVLIVAAATFMVQELGDAAHYLRYIAFLGFTGLLTLVGFACATRFKDDKSARTFLAVAAAVIPAHFAILGAFVYSRMGDVLTNYPPVLLWKADSHAAAAALCAFGFAVLIPVAFTAFSALLRPLAGKLTVCFLAANAVLLLPVREPTAVGLIGMALLSAIFTFDIKYLNRNPLIKTWEGILTRLLLAAPFLVMCGRTYQLYLFDHSLIFSAMLCATLALTLFIFIPNLVEKDAAAISSQAISSVPAVLSWWLVAADVMQQGYMRNYEAAFLGVPAAALLFGMSFAARSKGKGFRAFGSTIALLAVLAGLPETAQFSALLCVAVGLVTAIHGSVEKNWAIVSLGALSFMLGLAFQFKTAIALYPWAGLSLLGVLTVLAATLIEKRFPQLLRRAQVQ